MTTDNVQQSFVSHNSKPQQTLVVLESQVSSKIDGVKWRLIAAWILAAILYPFYATVQFARVIDTWLDRIDAAYMMLDYQMVVAIQWVVDWIIPTPMVTA